MTTGLTPVVDSDGPHLAGLDFLLEQLKLFLCHGDIVHVVGVHVGVDVGFKVGVIFSRIYIEFLVDGLPQCLDIPLHFLYVLGEGETSVVSREDPKVVILDGELTFRVQLEDGDLVNLKPLEGGQHDVWVNEPSGVENDVHGIYVCTIVDVAFGEGV